MFKKLFSKPLVLVIEDQQIQFSSLADFEFCLNGKTAIPADKFKSILKLTRDQLEKEAKSIKAVEKRFVNILSHSIEDPASICSAIKETDIAVFSKDHGWRDIMFSFNDISNAFDPFRRVALVKYMQYLGARQDMIKRLYHERQNAQDIQEEPVVDLPDFKETVHFPEKLLEQHRDLAMHEFARMPKGEVIMIMPTLNSNIIITLSKYKCILVFKAHGEFYFMEPNGVQHQLSIGRNSIGRDTYGTVSLDPSLREISRLHLVITTHHDDSLELTDFSAHGTYISNTFLNID